jgi:hypothetical protein
MSLQRQDLRQQIAEWEFWLGGSRQESERERERSGRGVIIPWNWRWLIYTLKTGLSNPHFHRYIQQNNTINSQPEKKKRRRKENEKERKRKGWYDMIDGGSLKWPNMNFGWDPDSGDRGQW